MGLFNGESDLTTPLTINSFLGAVTPKDRDSRELYYPTKGNVFGSVLRTYKHHIKQQRDTRSTKTVKYQEYVA